MKVVERVVGVEKQRLRQQQHLWDSFPHCRRSLLLYCSAKNKTSILEGGEKKLHIISKDQVQKFKGHPMLPTFLGSSPDHFDQFPRCLCLREIN